MEDSAPSCFGPPSPSQPNFCLDIVIYKHQCFLKVLCPRLVCEFSTGRKEPHLHSTDSSMSPNPHQAAQILHNGSYIGAATEFTKPSVKMKIWASLFKIIKNFKMRTTEQLQDPPKHGALQDSTGHTPMEPALVLCDTSGSLLLTIDYLLPWAHRPFPHQEVESTSPLLNLDLTSRT